MKKKSQFTDFYYKKLYYSLKELEKEHRVLKDRILTIGVIYSILFLLLSTSLIEHTLSIDLLFLLLFAYFGIGRFVYKFLIKDYIPAFKEKIIAPLIVAIDERLSYSAYFHVDVAHFSRSELFSTTPDRVNGNDCVYGKIDGVLLEFSDFHAEKKYKDSKGRESWSTMPGTLKC